MLFAASVEGAEDPALEVLPSAKKRGAGRFMLHGETWEVSGRFETTSEGRLVISAVTIALAKGADLPASGLRSAELNFGLDRLLHRVYLRLSGARAGPMAAEARRRFGFDTRTEAPARRPPGRPPLSNDFYHRVAEVLLELQQEAVVDLYDEAGSVLFQEGLWNLAEVPTMETVRTWRKKAQREGFIIAGGSGRSARFVKGPKFDSYMKGRGQ